MKQEKLKDLYVVCTYFSVMCRNAAFNVFLCLVVCCFILCMTWSEIVIAVVSVLAIVVAGLMVISGIVDLIGAVLDYYYDKVSIQNQ